MILVRQEIGEVLRELRQQKGRTLRQVASRASVALGYLSEVERGQKEASSEILASVAEALDVPISSATDCRSSRVCRPSPMSSPTIWSRRSSPSSPCTDVSACVEVSSIVPSPTSSDLGAVL